MEHLLCAAAEDHGCEVQLPHQPAYFPGVLGHDEQDLCGQPRQQDLHCWHQVPPLVHQEPAR